MAFFSEEIYPTHLIIAALTGLYALIHKADHQWLTPEPLTDDYIHYVARRMAIKALYDRGIRLRDLPPLPDIVPFFAEWRAREELKREAAPPVMAIEIPTTPPTESPPITLCSCFH